MLDRPSLDVELQAIGGEGVYIKIDALVYRSIALRHFMPPRRPSPLYASGTIDSRFAPPGRSYPCLYAALDVATAHREGHQEFYAALAQGVGPDKLKPFEEGVMIGVRFKAGKMLDVRDHEVQARLGTSEMELTGKWQLVPDAPTQRLGDAVHASGYFEGIVYSSARNPGGTCLVVFPERLVAGSFVRFRSRTAGVPNAQLSVR